MGLMPVITPPYRGVAIRLVWHNFTTYYISACASRGRLHIDCSLLNGNYIRISTQNASGRLFRLSYEHAVEPDASHDAFGYIVLPNTLLPNITDQPSVAMTTGNNSSGAVHVITNSSAGIVSVVFWQPEARTVVHAGKHTLNLRASLPCLVLLHAEEAGQLLSVSASSPDQPGNKLTLAFGLTLASARCWLLARLRGARYHIPAARRGPQRQHYNMQSNAICVYVLNQSAILLAWLCPCSATLLYHFTACGLVPGQASCPTWSTTMPLAA